MEIKKNSVQETLIIPLLARKESFSRYPFIYQDQYVNQIIDKIDYPFTHKKPTFIEKFSYLECALREYDIKCEIESFLKVHPNGCIVNMGCGLDFICENICSTSQKIYNVDYFEVINLRKKLLQTNHNVINISSDLKDFSWLDKIQEKKEVLFFASGVFYYLQKEEVINLLLNIEHKFSDSKIVFDIANQKAVKLMVKSLLKDINNVNAYFYIDNFKDFQNQFKKAKVSYKPYLTGYYSMKKVSLLYKLISKFADKNMKLRIIKMEV